MLMRAVMLMLFCCGVVMLAKLILAGGRSQQDCNLMTLSEREYRIQGLDPHLQHNLIN